VVGVVAVAASTLALLIAGHPLQDALLGGAGIALIGAEVARRVVQDAGLGPTGVVAGVVSGLGSAIYVMGYGLTDVACAAGVVGLVAGELAGRLTGTDRRWSRTGTDGRRSRTGTDGRRSRTGIDRRWSRTGTDGRWSRTGTDGRWSRTGTDRRWSRTGA